MGKPVARPDDMHACSLEGGDGLLDPVSYAFRYVGPIEGPGAPYVEAGGKLVARITDLTECVLRPKDMISQGSASVTVGGLPVARKGDKTMHGGVIVEGDENIEIDGSTIGVGGKIDGASLDQARLIILAHVRALEMIDAALEALRNAWDKKDDRLDLYFKIGGTSDDDRWNILMLMLRYQGMRDKMGGIGYSVENKETGAYASVDKYWFLGWNHYGDVNVFFPDFSTQSAEDMAATVVHEMAHRSADVEDIASALYPDDGKAKAMDRGDRMNNADTYGEFAKVVAAH